MDERLGLGALIERPLTDPRTGPNRQCPLPDLFRQSISSRLAGYEDTHDAERRAEDPACRMRASRERRETRVARTSPRHGFDTDGLTEAWNDQGLARLNTDLLQPDATLSPSRRVTLDVESVCSQPLFVFNRDGDGLAATLRPGNGLSCLSPSSAGP